MLYFIWLIGLGLTIFGIVQFIVRLEAKATFDEYPE